MRTLADALVLALVVSAGSFGVACAPNSSEETAPTDDAPIASSEHRDDGDDDDGQPSDGKNTSAPAPGGGSSAPSGSTPSDPATTPAPTTPSDPTTPAPPTTPSSPECLATSVAEIEANDTADTATTVPGATGSFCGTIAEDADVDFFSFTAPANAQGLAFGAAYSKKGATVEVAVDGGAAVQLGTSGLKLVPGGKYVVKVSGPAALTYRVDLTVK